MSGMTKHTTWNRKNACGQGWFARNLPDGGNLR